MFLEGFSLAFSYFIDISCICHVFLVPPSFFSGPFERFPRRLFFAQPSPRVLAPRDLIEHPKTLYGCESKPNGYLFGVGYHPTIVFFKRLLGCSPYKTL